MEKINKTQRNTVTPDFVREVLDTVLNAQEFQVSNVRNAALLKVYAEMQFRLNGGDKCALCNAHVRHVIPIAAEQKDGTVKNFSCLCMRCYEGERGLAKKIVMQIGDARVESTPVVYGTKTGRMSNYRTFADNIVRFPDKKKP